MILRTYMCGECGYRIDAELSSDQWNAEPPDCPQCAVTPMAQEFKPPAIGGSNIARATEIAHTIAAEDYNVADIQSASRSGRSVRYRDQTGPEARSTWATASGQLAQAIAIGRETRLKHGNGLDILSGALKSGAQPDLIEMSKKRSIRVY